MLDRPHLKSHLFETAEARGLEPDKRKKWVTDVLGLIDAGDVADVANATESVAAIDTGVVLRPDPPGQGVGGLAGHREMVTMNEVEVATLAERYKVGRLLATAV